MNNKLLKQNAIMILYIINFIEQLEHDICKLKKDGFKTDHNYIDIKIYKQIKEYFEKCLEEVYGKRNR
ncbi:MAG: hypothetical protein V8Q75_03430 [Bacilli bacterium]